MGHMCSVTTTQLCSLQCECSHRTYIDQWEFVPIKFIYKYRDILDLAQLATPWFGEIRINF